MRTKKYARQDNGEPQPVDVHLSRRLYQRRVQLGITQQQLAEAVGITFQQIQKYERATNRMSGSRLWDLAVALDVTPAYFFEGLTVGSEPPEPQPNGNDDRGTALMMRAYRSLPEKVQHRLLALARALAGQEEMQP